MSGGSWNYAYAKVVELAERLSTSEDALRKMFGAHLRLCAKALNHIEWVDSDDFPPGREVEAVKEALKMSPEETVNQRYVVHYAAVSFGF